MLRSGMEPPQWAQIRDEFGRAAFYDTWGYFSQTYPRTSQQAFAFPDPHMIPYQGEGEHPRWFIKHGYRYTDAFPGPFNLSAKFNLEFEMFTVDI